MKQVRLGWNGPEVSQVCFGSLAISPLQGRLSSEEGVNILHYALEQGIDWVDTAEIYDNYPQIAQALKNHPQVKIVTKSYAVTAEDLTKSLERARRELNRDSIDFFLLHEQESAYTLKGHQGAWEELLRAKQRGLVHGIGISTHAVAAVRAGALLPGIDVIHPILNYEGLGIIDGTLQEMLAALEFASGLGLGLYAMKVFGGGHLAHNPQKALDFICSIQGVQAMALGMASREEIDYNLKYLAGEIIPPELADSVVHRPRKLFIADWCQGCGSCLNSCPQGALYLEKTSVEDRTETVRLDADACVLCGYCGRACPHFCLKIV